MAPTAPPSEIQSAVTSMVRERRTRTTARVLGISPPTVARIVAGLAVAPGTIAIVREALRHR